jgi:hypothetical protein
MISLRTFAIKFLFGRLIKNEHIIVFLGWNKDPSDLGKFWETQKCLVLSMNKMGIDYTFETMSEYVTW